MSDSDRSALESDGRGGLESTAEPDTAPADIRYVYYLLYANGDEIPSKVAFDPEEPSLGRIRADSIAPPHSPTSIKRFISRVERMPALANADLFAGDIPLKEGHISFLRTDGPGLSPNEPIAIVQVKKPESPDPPPVASIPDGKYFIKNRTGDYFWAANYNPMKTVYFYRRTMADAKKYNCYKWDITNDTNGYIFMTSPFAPSLWAGADFTGSTAPVPWRLIPADSGSYYLTTDLNRVSQNPRVPAARTNNLMDYYVPGSMATLKEGDQWQMWEFIRI